MRTGFGWGGVGLKERDSVEDIGVSGRIIISSTDFKMLDAMTQTGLMRLRVMPVHGLF
jgi:hypothetical protein